jgi:hypothetical protein
VASVVNATAIHRIADASAAEALAARTGTRLAPAALAAPGAAASGAELFPVPAVAAGTLLSLRPGQFVLTVNSPGYRLVELAETVPARLPRKTVAAANQGGGR